MFADVVGDPAGSPFTCSRIRTGMQVLKGVAEDVAPEAVATMPAWPGVPAVTSPFVSTVAIPGSVVLQVNEPIPLVISAALGAQGPDDAWGIAKLEQACAVNCCVCVLEVQPEGAASTTTEVTLGWTVMVNGVLVTPDAVAVMLAVPL